VTAAAEFFDAAGTPSARRRGRAKRLVRLLLSPSIVFILLVVIGATFAGPISGRDPSQIVASERFQSPSSDHLLGTDQLGRDTFTRMLYGARVSLLTAAAAALLSIVSGALLGLAAGFLRGPVDAAISYVADVIMAFPAIVFALFLLAVFGSEMKNVILALAIYGIPPAFRVVRGQVLVTRELDYVSASIAVGASPVRTAVRHVLPNSIAPLTVAVPLAMSGAVLAEAGLSFLGLGVRPPTPTWGGMLADGYSFIYDHPRLAIIPGLAVFLLVLALNGVGDQMRSQLSRRR
jgi:peptide/nickel transport system permease protein